MIAKPKKAVEDETNTLDLRKIIVNAKLQGDIDYENRAKRQLWRLHAIGETELERRFGEVMAAYETFLTEKNQRTTHATRTWQKVKNKGVKQALNDWALSKNATSGFISLIEAGLSDVTAEHLILSMPDEFEPKVVEAARKRLKDHGVIVN